MTKKATALLSDIMTAVTNCALYSIRHEAVRKVLKHAVGQVESLLDETTRELAIMAPGDTVLINGVPLKDRPLYVLNFVKRLRRKGVEQVLFRDGVTQEEFRAFITWMASPGAPMEHQDHIALGVIEVRDAASGDGSPAASVQQNMEHIDAIEQGFVASGKLDTVALEEVVINFIVTLQREANVLKLLSPMRDHNEYTFAHSTNVTLLTIFQAESIGLAGEYLREIGLAALLHDMGKMFVPKSIIEKPGKLTEAEWYEMKKHPVHGARYLSTIPEITNLAIVGAFEHHMKFDGAGYPETFRRARRQHLVSQLISIADFFDALRTERPYRQTMEVDVVIGMLREGSGTDFNQNLVNHFIGSLKAVGAY